MARASASSRAAAPRRLPRGRHALAPEEVLRDQRERLVDAVPRVAAERGYEAMSVADLVKAAAVSRNAFYKNFADKAECVAAAQEVGHERLFEVLVERCEESSSLEARVEAALSRALEALAADPETACLLFVEAPAAATEIALRYHEWLQQYGTLLRMGAPDLPARSLPAPEVEAVIVGGIASRIGSELLHGRAGKLSRLTPALVEYVLAFYGLDEARKSGRRLAA